MGDEAEGVFDAVFPKNHAPGLNRPQMNVGALTLRQRYIPDRLDALGYAEVMGLGWDQTLKWKLEKIEALVQWSTTDPVTLFVWDRKNKRWCRESISAWFKLALEHGVYGEFSDGKQYVGIKTKHMPFAWTRHEPVDQA